MHDFFSKVKMDLNFVFRFAVILLFIFPAGQTLAQQQVGEIQINYDSAQPINKFVPAHSIGGAYDGQFKGGVDNTLNLSSIAMMKTVGFKPVAYRLRTELAGEVWHWNPHGHWSEPDRKQGYWISDTNSASPIHVSNGYRLPRRGNTIDQANNDGYSRIDDGDVNTFWKSNPYLDSHFTKESNQLHPQWVIIDLEKKRPINALRINWGNPHALAFKAEYAKDVDPGYFDPFQPGIWHSFSKDSIKDQNGKDNIVRISKENIHCRFIKISMSQSSYTACKGCKDLRDSLGFSIKEISAGYLTRKGKFIDFINHRKDQEQTMIYVSSTDPWHTSKDLDPNVEQAGIDFFFTSGITPKEPVLMPAAVLYDIPENMESLVEYLQNKKYPVSEFEMGEEPEGQRVAPEDYAALYLQLAKRIKKKSSMYHFGGPGFASISATPEDSTSFTEADWTKRFLNYMKKHNAQNLFNFFSFEWYPFDDLCESPASQLKEAPGMLETALNNFKNILPAGTKKYITEYGYSAYEGRIENKIEGALMYADILGKFLECGGNKAFLYGYEPAYLQQTYSCGGYGNNMLFGLGPDGKIKYKTASYYAMKLITQEWASPADHEIKMYPVVINKIKHENQNTIAAYALCDSSGVWKMMIINKDPQRSIAINVSLFDQKSGTKKEVAFSQMIQYSGKQYHWKDIGINSYPDKDLPPEYKQIHGGKQFLLPPYSITILK